MSRAVFQSTLGGSTTLDAEQTADTKTLVIPAADGTLVYTDDAGVASFDDISLTGAVIAGAWDGDTIDVAHGGTGAVTLTGYVKGAGTTAMTASATIPNSDITGLGTMSTQNASAVAITGGTISGLGTPLAVPSGGSGAATLTGYVKGNGTSAMTASATIPNTDISGLGTMSVQNANNVAITGGTISGLGTALAVPSGGTGATTLTGYVKGAGTSAMTASATIPNTDIAGLGTMSTQNSDAVTITGGTANGLTIGGSTPAAVTATTLRVNSTISLAGNTGTAGQILTSNGGSAPTWTSVAGVGTVTSVDGSGGTTGLSLTGGPITASGTLTLGGTLAVANGGTGSTTAANALTALGAYPASNPSGFGTGTVTSVGGTGTVNGLTLTGTVTTSGNLTLGGTLDLSAPPAIGGTTAAAVTGTTITANTKFVSPHFDAANSAGGALRNASGVAQLQWGGGGGSNLTVDVAMNINPANAAVSIAPTGTGTVTINPATAGTMNNVVIGGTTPAAGSFTTLSMNGGAISPQTGFKNRIINGAMTIDQRNAGAAVTALDSYAVDRWQYEGSQTSKFTLQQNAGSVTPPVGFTNYYGATSSSAYSVGASDFFFISQRIEGFNVADLGWGTANAATVTLSFWVRSSLTGTFGGALSNEAANRSYPFSYSISSANTWEQKSITITGDTSGTWITNNGLGIRIRLSLGAGSTLSGTAGAWAASNFISATGATSVVGTNGATFYITGVQLEKGSTATPFEFRSIGTELGLCQRYLYVLPGGSHTSGYNISTTQAYIPVVFPVTPRVASTGISTTLSGNLFISSSGYALTNLEFVASSTQTVLLRATTAQTMTTNNGNMLELGNKVLFTGCEL